MGGGGGGAGGGGTGAGGGGGAGKGFEGSQGVEDHASTALVVSYAC